MKNVALPTMNSGESRLNILFAEEMLNALEGIECKADVNGVSYYIPPY